MNPTISTTCPRVNAFRVGSHVVGTTLTASGVSLDLPTHIPVLPVGWNFDCLCSGSINRSPDWPKHMSRFSHLYSLPVMARYGHRPSTHTLQLELCIAWTNPGPHSDSYMGRPPVATSNDALNASFIILILLSTLLLFVGLYPPVSVCLMPSDASHALSSPLNDLSSSEWSLTKSFLGSLLMVRSSVLILATAVAHSAAVLSGRRRTIP